MWVALRSYDLFANAAAQQMIHSDDNFRMWMIDLIVGLSTCKI